MQTILHKQEEKHPLNDTTKLERILQLAIEIVTTRYKNGKAKYSNLKLHTTGLINICLVDSEHMTELNEDFVGHEGTTDVITFDYRDEFMSPEEDDDAGEIYVCLDVAEERASEFKTSFTSESILYMVHGMLHLLGEDDQTPEEKDSMRTAEAQVMEQLQETENFEGIFTN